MGIQSSGPPESDWARRTITRRRLLGGAAALGTLAVAGTTLRAPRLALAAEEFPGRPDRFGMLTDTTKCLGCRMCETACAKTHQLPEPTPGTGVYEKTRRPSARAFTVVNRYASPGASDPVFRKVQCMHCDEPACASACLVGAIKKTPEGPVLYNESVCIGCRYCMVACPFSMLGYEYDDALAPALKKCVMCYERIRQEGGQPACAAACPTQATIFGRRSDLIKVARERIQKEPGKYVDHIYGETEAGGTGWLYLSAVPFEDLGFPKNVGKTPYPELTRDFLLAVPLVLMMWPAGLLGVNALLRRRERSLREEPEGEKATEEELK